MSVSFAGFITIDKVWTDFKSVLSVKSLAPQYEETDDLYTIFAIDGSLVYVSIIYRGTVPPESGVDQGVNDGYKSDFETNYKPNANQSISAATARVVDGYNTTTGTTNTALMASTYVEQTTNAQRSIVSSDANDTSAGTGVRTIRITYYDQTMAGPFTEIVTMAGTTPVDTVSSTICFIEKMEAVTVGSNGGNVGTISLKAAASGGGATVGSIIAGDNETNWCHHYVATGRVARVAQIIANAKGPYSGFVRLRKFTPTVANSPDFVIAPALRVRAGAQDQINFVPEIPVSGPARLILYGQSDGSVGTQDWVAGFTFHES